MLIVTILLSFDQKITHLKKFNSNNNKKAQTTHFLFDCALLFVSLILHICFVVYCC